MKTEISKIENEITVFADGKAFISQRKLAELLDVKPSALMMYLVREHQNYNTINGLDAKMVKVVSTYFAYKSRKPSKQAQELVDQMLEAGALMWMYHQAGFNSKPPAKALPTPRRNLKKHEYNNGQDTHYAVSDQKWVSVLAFCHGDQTKAHKLNTALVEAGEINATTRLKKTTDYSPTEFEDYEFKRFTVGKSFAYDQEWLEDFCNQIGFN